MQMKEARPGRSGGAQMADGSDEMRAFLFVVRRALLLVVRWIEDRYGWRESRRERSSRD